MNMTSQAVEAALAAKDFEPLRIHLASGTFCDILHPDSIFIHDRQLLIIDRVDPGGNIIRAYRFLDPQLIQNLIPLRLATTESHADELSNRELIAPAARAIDWLESLLALLATALICAIVAFSGVSIYLNVGNATFVDDAAALLIWTILIVIELVLLVRVARFYQKRLYPLPLLYALAHEPPRFTLARLALAAFWLAHATAGVLAFAWIDFSLSAINRGRTAADRWLDDVVLLILVSAGAHASMTFFLLAARSIGATPRILRRLWTFRILIDLLVVGSVILFPTWLPLFLRPLSLVLRNLRFLIGH
jgi:hypothetical protein